MAFNKRNWIMNSLKSGYDKGIWTEEHVMENALKYSMAGILTDEDLAELAEYTETKAEVVEDTTDTAEDATSETEVLETSRDEITE